MIKGVDVSHYTPGINWDVAKVNGVHFALIKACEGVSFPDQLFQQTWARTKASGIMRGAYHFFHDDVDARDQANLFLKLVGPLEADDLPCVIDMETHYLNVPIFMKNVLLFIQIIEQATKKPPIIYASPRYLKTLGSAKDVLVKYPLWIAHYGVAKPSVPLPWKYFTFWQTGEKDLTMSGADIDYFNGSLEHLKLLASGGI